MIRAEWSRVFMLSEQQRRTALKKNIEYARDMARRLRAEGVEGITLTHFADEESFHAMQLPEQGDDFEYRQLVNAETAKIMIAHGLQLVPLPSDYDGLASDHFPAGSGTCPTKQTVKTSVQRY